MKITQDVREYAAKQGVAEEQALAKGMEEKARGVREAGRGDLYSRVDEVKVRYAS